MKLRNAHVLIGVLTCLLCSPFAGNAALNGSETPSDARGWIGRGEDAAARGDFSAQIDAWTQAARLFAAAGNDSEYRAAVARRGDAFLAAGRYQDAIRDLRQVADEEREQGHAARTAAVLSSLGNAYLFNGDSEEAGKALTESVSLARNSGDSNVEAVALNNLGNWQTDREDYREALETYEQAATLSASRGDHLLEAKARVNAARAAQRSGDNSRAQDLLNKASLALEAQQDSHDKAYTLLNLGRVAQLPASQDESTPLDRELARRAYYSARDSAVAVGDRRAESYAYGYLAETAMQAGRPREAVALNEHALFVAQQIGAPELLYRWYWQVARSYRDTGQLEGAVNAYREAIRNLQLIRTSLSSRFRRHGTGFRDVAGPLYLELADLLLQDAAVNQDPEQAKAFLIEARLTIEQLKTAELEDYFLDPCVAVAQSKSTGLDELAERTAVLYPILLPDRIALLVSLPSGSIVQRTVTGAGKDDVTEEVGKFRKSLTRPATRRYRNYGAQLYDWFIGPVEKDLREAQINTLVIVPDGPLRTIPMAPLYDKANRKHLVEKYALATTPGLTLTDARPLERGESRMLLNGITVEVGEFSSLPAVEQELADIQEIMGKDNVTLLKNKDFVLENLESELTGRPYSIVHIASHGVFASDVRKSFLLTYREDQRLYMDQLEEFMSLRRFNEEPIELLTLSACETARGDDELAALGLSGIAIKSGARSALGTLWNVHDQASSVLVTNFYRQLSDPGNSKAEALRQAQIDMLSNKKDKRFRHPAYWSPFLLIGNWL